MWYGGGWMKLEAAIAIVVSGALSAAWPHVVRQWYVLRGLKPPTQAEKIAKLEARIRARLHPPGSWKHRPSRLPVIR